MSQTLITRLSKLDAPDREVDGLIAETFGFPQEVFGESFGTYDVDGPEMHYDAATWSGNGKSWSAPFFTASVDAAIALAKRVCDPAWIRIDEWYMGEEKPAVAAILLKPTPNETFGGKGANQSIALLIALLRAKEASKP